MLFECMGICVLSPAHESEMRGYLVYVMIVKYLLHRFCLNSAPVYWFGRPCRGIGGIFYETFLEGSVDRVIYWDYIVNRRFFIYCRLAISERGSDVVASGCRDPPQNTPPLELITRASLHCADN